MRALTPALLVIALGALCGVPAGACVKPYLLEVTDPRELAAMQALDASCREGLRLLRDGRPAEALAPLKAAAAQPDLLDTDLKLPLAEALFSSGGPVEATLLAWEGVQEPDALVQSRRFELVERLSHGRAAALLTAAPDRAARALLASRKARDSRKPAATKRKVDPHRVGVLLPLSGRLAKVGQRLLDGMRLGLDEDTSLVVRDTAGLPGRAAALVSELADEGVIVMLGPLDRSVASAAAEAATSLEVPLVRLSIEDPVLPPSDWVFRAFLSRRADCRALVRLARREGLSRFAVVHADSGWGAALSRTFAAEVEAAEGARLVTSLPYPKDALNVRKVAKELRRAPVDVVFVADKPDRAGLVLRFLAREDIWTRAGRKRVTASGEVRYVQIFGPSEWKDRPIAEDDVRYLSGVVVASGWPGSADTAVAALSARATAAFGHGLGRFGAIGHDALMAVQAAGASTRKALAQRLRSPDRGARGVLGELRFDAAGEPIRSHRLYRAMKTAFVPLNDGTAARQKR